MQFYYFIKMYLKKSDCTHYTGLEVERAYLKKYPVHRHKRGRKHIIIIDGF